MPPVTEQRPRVTEEGQAAAARIAAARAAKNASIEPTVSANELTSPPAQVNPPVPNVNTNDGSRTNNLVGNVVNQNDGIIRSTSENAQKRDELAGLLGEQNFDAAGQRADLTKQFGVTDNLSRLTDIQTQLAQRNTESGLRKVEIESGGQGAIQGQRSLTQEDRENAVRNAGLAAEASVLSGNIQTASTLINNAMQDFYSDRTLKNQNMINQLEYFSGLADEETKQLLEKEQRGYEADQKKIERTLDAVDQAVTSGAATPDEIKMLTDPRTTDEDRTSLAQAITGRAAKSLYDAELYGKYLSNAVAQKELDALSTPPDPTVVPEETLKAVNDLTDGQRTAITGSRETINEINRMIALVETAGDMSLLTKATEEGREFLRLRKNVVDKLARQRTGAVVGVDEEKTFKDILGVGVFDLIAKDDEEVINGLKKFRTPHEESLNLNDPTGTVRNFLDSSKVGDDEEINAIWGVSIPSTNTPVSNYYK